MTPAYRPLPFWTLACVLTLGTALPGLAQDAAEDPADPPPAETAADLPEMAEIERAWARGDNVTVRNGLKVLAEETGTPLAQYRYGRVLIEGRGGPADPEAAVLWLGRAVEQNHLEAATLLARIYLSAVPGGPERDADRAAELLTRSATRGDASAQYLLGLLYQKGDGVGRDMDAAFNWFLAAAEQQHAEAQFTLSELYLTGEQRNLAEGERWLREAAGAGIPEAQLELAMLLDDPVSGMANATEALDWYRRAAEAGQPVAQRILGTYYLQGDRVQANAQEAFRWLSSAAGAGDPGAMSNLGYAYATGSGVQQDMAMAARWYSAAADQGLGRAMVALARQLEHGSGVPQDLDTAVALHRRALETPDAAMARRELARLAIAGQLDGRVAPERAVPWVLAAARDGQDGAVDWLRARAEADDPRAQSALGRYLFDTELGQRDAALDMLQAAATGADPQAQFALAEILARGDHGAAPDYVQAHKWYNVAATLGHPQAADRREVLGNLMTPDQVAAAQEAARAWFEADALRLPGTGGN